jgi:hypothetical protein
LVLLAKAYSIFVVVVGGGGGGGGDQGPESMLRFALQPLGLLYTLFLEVITVAARCLHVLRDARDPSTERWNFNGRERVDENFV